MWRLLAQLDMSGAGPPWPVSVYNPDSGALEPLGIVGGTGPVGPAGPTGAVGPQGPAGARALSGPLELLPRHSGVLDGDYLATMDGLAVLTATGAAIATRAVRVVQLPEQILTARGEVIGV